MKSREVGVGYQRFTFDIPDHPAIRGQQLDLAATVASAVILTYSGVVPSVPYGGFKVSCAWMVEQAGTLVFGAKLNGQTIPGNRDGALTVGPES